MTRALVVFCYVITLSVIIVSMDIALYLTPQPDPDWPFFLNYPKDWQI